MPNQIEHCCLQQSTHHARAQTNLEIPGNADFPAGSADTPHKKFPSLMSTPSPVARRRSLIVIDQLKDVPISGEKPRLKVNQYVLLSRLGRGSFSNVFLGYSTETGAYSAVKVVKTGNSRDVRLVQRELSMLRAIDHASIVSLHDVLFSAARSEVFVVLELSDCGSLASVFEKGQLSEDQIRSVFKQVAMALEHLHEQRFVHQDVSPSNILVWSDGRAKLTDFGACVAFDEFQGEGIGTPAYQAPEIFNVDDEGDGKLDADKVDVYGLGATLFQAKFGRVPYEGEDVWEIVAKVAENELVIPTDGVSEELRSLIGGMLEVDPAKRLSMREVVNHPFFERFAGPVPIHTSRVELVEFVPGVTLVHEIKATVCDKDYAFLPRKAGSLGEDDFRGSLFHAHSY